MGYSITLYLYEIEPILLLARKMLKILREPVYRCEPWKAAGRGEYSAVATLFKRAQRVLKRRSGVKSPEKLCAGAEGSVAAADGDSRGSNRRSRHAAEF